MTGPELESRVRTLVASHLDLDPGRLTDEARLGDDLCVDSLTAVEMAMVLEDEFEISLPEDVLAGMQTYGDLVSAVGARVDGQGNGDRRGA